MIIKIDENGGDKSRATNCIQQILWCLIIILLIINIYFNKKYLTHLRTIIIESNTLVIDRISIIINNLLTTARHWSNQLLNDIFGKICPNFINFIYQGLFIWKHLGTNTTFYFFPEIFNGVKVWGLCWPLQNSNVIFPKPLLNNCWKIKRSGISHSA